MSVSDIATPLFTYAGFWVSHSDNTLDLFCVVPYSQIDDRCKNITGEQLCYNEPDCDKPCSIVIRYEDTKKIFAFFVPLEWNDDDFEKWFESTGCTQINLNWEYNTYGASIRLEGLATLFMKAKWREAFVKNAVASPR